MRSSSTKNRFLNLFSRKKDRVQHLLALMKIDEKCLHIVDNFSKNLPPDTKEIVERVAQENLRSLLDAVEEAYANRLKKSTINDMISFYESDAGKDYSEAQDKLEQDMTICSTVWIQNVLQDAEQEIIKKHWKDKADRGVDWRSHLPPLE